MVYVLCYPINVSYLLHYCLYLSLELFSKGGCAQFQGAWILRSWLFYSLHMSFAQICHMSYAIDYLSDGGYQSHSVTLTCHGRPRFVSVTLGVGYSLVNWQIFEGLLLRHFPRQTSRSSVGGPCAKRGIRAWSLGISIVIGIVCGHLIEVCSVASAHLLKGQFDSLVIAAEHNNYLRPTCTTSLLTIS